MAFPWEALLGFGGAALNFFQGQSTADAIQSAGQTSPALEALLRQQALLATGDQTDALGNKFITDAATGDRSVELEPRTQGIVDTSVSLEQQNIGARGDETGFASSQLAELGRGSPYDVNAIKAALIAQGQHGLNEGFDATEGNVIRQALRSGSPEPVTGGALASLGKARAQAFQGNRLSAEVEAPKTFEALEGARNSRIGGNALNFSQLGSGGAGFTPVNTNATSTLTSIGNQAIVGTNAAVAGQQGAQNSTLKAMINAANLRPNAGDLFSIASRGVNPLFNERQLSNSG